jgi:hypothetical protein
VIQPSPEGRGWAATAFFPAVAGRVRGYFQILRRILAKLPAKQCLHRRLSEIWKLEIRIRAMILRTLLNQEL